MSRQAFKRLSNLRSLRFRHFVQRRVEIFGHRFSGLLRNTRGKLRQVRQIAHHGFQIALKHRVLVRNQIVDIRGRKHGLADLKRLFNLALNKAADAVAQIAAPLRHDGNGFKRSIDGVTNKRVHIRSGLNIGACKFFHLFGCVLLHEPTP